MKNLASVKVLKTASYSTSNRSISSTSNNSSNTSNSTSRSILNPTTQMIPADLPGQESGNMVSPAVAQNEFGVSTHTASLNLRGLYSDGQFGVRHGGG